MVNSEIEQICNRLQAVIMPKQIYLFGSFAKDEQTKGGRGISKGAEPLFLFYRHLYKPFLGPNFWCGHCLSGYWRWLGRGDSSLYSRFA